MFPGLLLILYYFTDAYTFEGRVTNAHLCRLALTEKACHSQPRPGILGGPVVRDMGVQVLRIYGQAARPSVSVQGQLVMIQPFMSLADAFIFFSFFEELQY